MKKVFFLVTTMIVGVIFAKGTQLFAFSSYVDEMQSNVITSVFTSVSRASEEYEEKDTIAAAIVTHSDVNLKFTNDEVHPWTINENVVQNGNCGIKNSTSILSVNYKSNYKTEFSFDWSSYNYSAHSNLIVYVDGVAKGNTSDYSYSTCRFFIEAGEHVIVFKDSIGNSTSTNNFSYIKNVVIKEMRPLNATVLTEKSQPLNFINEGVWPWTIEDGYIQSSNYGHRNSVSNFSTTFTIEKPSKFSF